MAKNVVITGATSGIGEAIARAYLEQGENVVLTGRRTDRLEVLKSEFAESFPNQTVWTFPLDVTNMTMIGCYHGRQETTGNCHQTFDIGIQHGQHIQLFIVLIECQA